MAGSHDRLERSIRKHLLAGTAIALALTFGVAGWASTTDFAGAVIASGSLVVDADLKKVQHPTGGVVGELRVRDGDFVKAGDILLRLDETQTRANLAMVVKTLDELLARQSRLEAERDGAPSIEFPVEMTLRRDDPHVHKLLSGERKLFELREAARSGQKSQLKERTTQLQDQISGAREQISGKKKEVELINRELAGVQELWKMRLVSIQRLTALEREAARLEGEGASLVASVAQLKGKITETELQIIQIDQDLRTEVGKELADIRAKTSELVEKRVAAEDQLKRIDIRAPQDGVVHQLTAHTVGGVIAQGEPIMMVVPQSALTVEVKIAPQDIDQVRLGQRAVLRFPAFSQRTTPELNGEVSRISADISQDQKTGLSYYTVRIAVPEIEIKRLSGLKLVAGMPVESFIQTGERLVISYLTKPLLDQIAKAWRER